MFWSVEPFPALDIASILSIYQRWPGCKDVFDGLQGWGWMPILCHLSCLWMVLKPAKWTNPGFGFSELGCCSVLCSLLTQRFAASLAKFESGWSDEEPAERMHLREDQDAERTWGRSGQQTGDVDSVTSWNSRMVTMTELLFNDGIWNQSIHVNPGFLRIKVEYEIVWALGSHSMLIWVPQLNSPWKKDWNYLSMPSTRSSFWDNILMNSSF